MKTTGFVRRALGNAVGWATLVALTFALTPLFPGMDVVTKNWPTAVGFLLILSIISYWVWFRFEQIGVKWPSAVLISIGLGLVSLVLDFLFGRIFHPDLGVIQSTVSTLSFWLTMFICPLGTIVVLSGWARNVALGDDRTPPS
jgi:hypothetical protein